MAKKVDILRSPDKVRRTIPEFSQEEMDRAVFERGLECIIERAVRCPCAGKNNDHLSNCINCNGTGWLFINNSQDRVVVSSINYDTKYKGWTEMNVGTVSMTFQERSTVSYMDRVTIQRSNAVYTEVLNPFTANDSFFSYTIYNIESVVEVFRFVAPDEELRLLVQGTDYSISGNKLLITITAVADIAAIKALTGYVEYQKAMVSPDGAAYEFDPESVLVPNDSSVLKPDDVTLPSPGRWLRLDDYTVTIRYNHKLTYHVLDIPHVNRYNYKKNNLGRDEIQELPVSVVGRLVHYVLDAPNFNGTNVVDNSYN